MKTQLLLFQQFKSNNKFHNITKLFTHGEVNKHEFNMSFERIVQFLFNKNVNLANRGGQI